MKSGRKAMDIPPVDELGSAVAETAQRFHVSMSTAARWHRQRGIKKCCEGRKLKAAVPTADVLYGTSEEIGKRFGVSLTTAWTWKRIRGVPSSRSGRPRKPTPSPDELGAGNAHIAKRMGVTVTTVMRWKREHGITPNKPGTVLDPITGMPVLSPWADITMQERVSSTDQELADETGVSRERARQMRHKYAPESAAIRRNNR